MVKTESPSTIVGIFNDPAKASEAMRALRAAGFPDRDLGLAAKQWHDSFKDVRIDKQEAAEEGAVFGALTGAGVGAAVGLAGAAVILPVTAPLFLGGLLFGAVAGSAAGAAAGTFAGPFVALGLTETEAEKHSRRVEEGHIVVVVKAGARKDEAQRILTESGAYDDSMNTDPPSGAI